MTNETNRRIRSIAKDAMNTEQMFQNIWNEGVDTVDIRNIIEDYSVELVKQLIIDKILEEI